MTKIKSWDEMTPEAQERMRQMIRCETCRFTYTNVDAESKEVVLEVIERDQLQPFHTGESLHMWDECYLIGSECYQLTGAFSHPGEVMVCKIEDNCPEKGLIHETYRS